MSTKHNHAKNHLVTSEKAGIKADVKTEPKAAVETHAKTASGTIIAIHGLIVTIEFTTKPPPYLKHFAARYPLFCAIDSAGAS